MKFSDTILLSKEGCLLLKGSFEINLALKININFLGGKKNLLLLKKLYSFFKVVLLIQQS